MDANLWLFAVPAFFADIAAGHHRRAIANRHSLWPTLGLMVRPQMLAAGISQVIADDLVSSGRTAIQPPSLLTNITISASKLFELDARGQGSCCGFSFVDSDGLLQVDLLCGMWSRNAALLKGGSAEQAGLRRIAHQIADLFMKNSPVTLPTSIPRLYVSESGPAARRLKRLYIMDQDGHNHRFLTAGLDLVFPRFSPTAHKIAYLNYFNDEPNVYLLDVASGRTESWAAFLV